ncbi:MAG: periplasmic heavy metal sensor [Ignavibacteriales bacterium]|nr:periplasmic heavy metal sensor [Ignavibacteriales bacterium]
MKSRVILLISFLLIFPVTQLLSQGSGAMGDGPMMPRMRLMEELKLTDDQKKEVQKLHFDLLKQMIAQRSKIATSRLELQQMLNADNLDKAVIEKKIGEVSQLATQVHTMRLNQWFAVNKLLNADQQKVWKKALNMRANMAERMRMNRGMHRGMMGRGMMQRERMHQEMLREDDDD